jgi:chlorophyllide a reductase subunit Y
MCPAFGSLRVGLRMRRTATILSGSACCVYGLTFTSHFYGARRSVGYVPFNSESLVTGKLFEDIRDAVHKEANPDLFYNRGTIFEYLERYNEAVRDYGKAH